MPAFIQITTDHATGYASQQYADSLREFGDVLHLPRCGGSLLVSRVPRSELFDASGCYPLFACENWAAIHQDVDALADELVSVRLVTDPFANLNLEHLKAAFPDRCSEFKHHFVTDLSQALETTVSAHHQRNVRKALAALNVRESTGDTDLVPKWLPLYSTLVHRHGIRGIARFSPASFEMQTRVPGFISFSALDGDETCGMTWWYVTNGVAYYHLAAYSEHGYACRASYALFWTALKHFAAIGLRWASLGAGAGLRSADSGLTRFKRGWSTQTRRAYFCGRIYQPTTYATLVAAASARSAYFPAYRAA